jgi:hypothetical protein
VAVADRTLGENEAPTIQIPVLCRFWEEDGVWNGSAEDLPVAGFGDTFEQAQHHVFDAVIAHLQSVQEVGDIQATIDQLRHCARSHRFTVEQMASDQPLVRFNAALQNQHITALV